MPTWSSPGEFAHEVTGGLWKFARHLSFLNGKLVDLADRSIYRLMVQMPPRHGKSELVGRFFIAWYLLMHPEHRVIYVSNTASQANKYGRWVRALIREHGPRFGVYISSDRGAANDFELVDERGKNFGGGLVTLGVEGQLTGRGADLLVIDDPIKGPEQALSKLMRDKAWDLWAADASFRLQPNAVVIEIQTRWHEDDLAGRLEQGMTAGGVQWEIVRFPAIAEEHDILGRTPGEALWPEQYPITNPEKPDDPNTLTQIKITAGPYWWSAEYQQHPVPLEGAFFKKGDWRWFKVAPGGTLRDGPYILLGGKDEPNKLIPAGNGTLIICVDLATSEKTVADYTVWAIGRVLTNGVILILEVIREHLEGPEVQEWTVRIKQQWDPDHIGVEKKGFQLAVIQGIWRQNVPVFPIDAKGDKVGRALPISARVAAHTVYLLQGAGFTTDFIDETASFPRGTHDDQVDAFAYIGLEAERLGLGDSWVNYSAQETAKILEAQNSPGVVKKGLL